MGVTHLALVTESPRVRLPELVEVAAALQRQVARDFGPLWGVQATVDGFGTLEEVPPGYWPVMVKADTSSLGTIGIHLDDRGQPFAIVKDVPQWPYIASHEVLEMLADPHGNRLVPGGSPKPGQGLVDYLVEVCDPCASPEFGYTVNGILVSDFILPSYYDPVGMPGGRYSFTGAVDRPRGVLPGGYVAWQDPTNREWWRAERNGTQPLKFSSLGFRDFDGRPLRELVDLAGSLPVLYEGIPRNHPAVQAAEIRHESARAVSRANAAALRAVIAALDRPPAHAEADGGSMSTAPLPRSAMGPALLPFADGIDFMN